MSSGHTIVNLAAVENVAPKFGMEFGEARFPNDDLGNAGIGLAHYRFEPGRRTGFGHRHSEAEENYVVLEGSGRIKIGYEVIDVSTGDLVRVAPQVWREFESGDEGMVLLAAGQRIKGDGEMDQEFWTD